MKQKAFLDIYNSLQGAVLDNAIAGIENAASESVDSALSHIPLSSDGFLALLSDSADDKIKQIEKAARELTAQRFGRTVNLYIPLYLSNACVNRCAYCGFNRDEEIKRKTLSLTEVITEGERILGEGYKNILLVAGEDKREIPVSYIEACVKSLKDLGFVFVGIETQTFKEDEYRRLGAAGLDGVTIYQETYDRKVYEKVHLLGPKRNFEWRLETAERVARAGIRSVGLGFLLGLADFRREAVTLATHIKFMQKKYWQTTVSVSFPRLHSAPKAFACENKVSDAELIRLILAMRLANPDTLLALSTREPAKLRDRLFGAGINQVSAGSRTNPGGYSDSSPDEAAGEQFPVVDDRSPEEVVEAIGRQGLDWVWKDWDTTLKPVSG
ncbi:hypothetical protein MNBD_NITROSPINAE04-442 [hydrothermal vent metagenome]|uniref:Radical SAM core domain-containing protein n=1 Tax=hydrothermal vent metagenome TaxID=652676 RepID=A0A3B1CNV0_9ZZZZ